METLIELATLTRKDFMQNFIIYLLYMKYVLEHFLLVFITK